MDTVVETIGIEWDQERLAYYARPAGPAAAGVFRPAGARMKKFTDAHRGFAVAGKRVQGLAKQYEEEGRLIPARESYITASLLWSAARWPLYETDKSYLRNKAGALDILPGMEATVDIHTGKRSVLEYFLRPVLKLKSEAFRER